MLFITGVFAFYLRRHRTRAGAVASDPEPIAAGREQRILRGLDWRFTGLRALSSVVDFSMARTARRRTPAAWLPHGNCSGSHGNHPALIRYW